MTYMCCCFLSHWQKTIVCTGQSAARTCIVVVFDFRTICAKYALTVLFNLNVIFIQNYISKVLALGLENTTSYKLQNICILVVPKRALKLYYC